MTVDFDTMAWQSHFFVNLRVMDGPDIFSSGDTQCCLGSSVLTKWHAPELSTSHGGISKAPTSVVSGTDQVGISVIIDPDLMPKTRLITLFFVLLFSNGQLNKPDR